MVAENIYLTALSHLSDEDQKAMEAYRVEAEKVQHEGVVDSTVAIEDVLKQVPGAKTALRHYDKEVGKLMKARS